MGAFVRTSWVPPARRARRIAPRGLRAWIAAALALALLGVVAAAGCSPSKTLAPNVPPETILHIQGPVDTVNHVVHLYWFGSDPDGEVIGFEWRLDNPADTAVARWRYTTRTDSIFKIQTPGGFAKVTFEVRAVDDDSLPDPTPARHDSLKFSNRPPAVAFIDPPSAGTNDTTFASVTLRWAATDPDGDAVSFRVWLDRNQSAVRLTADRTITLPSADFCLGGNYYAGRRTAYVQAVDNGGLLGEIDSTTWYVKAPSGSVWDCTRRAKLLIIDDVPGTTGGGAIVDTMYRNAARRIPLPDSAFSITRINSRGPFRSTRDLEQTLALFDAVVWYRDLEVTTSSTLLNHQSAVATYLENGGKIYVEGLYILTGQNAPGALTEDFARRYLGTSDLYTRFEIATQETTASWGNENGGRLTSSLGDALLFQGALPVSGTRAGLRVFTPDDTAEVLVWAEDGALIAGVSDRLPIGMNVAQPGGGRAVVLAFPLRPTNGNGTTRAFLAKVLTQLLGITPVAAGLR
jgi:hypothetical protein